MGRAKRECCQTLRCSYSADRVRHARGGRGGRPNPTTRAGYRVRVSAAGIADSPLVGTIGALDDRSISLRVRAALTR